MGKKCSCGCVLECTLSCVIFIASLVLLHWRRHRRTELCHVVVVWWVSGLQGSCFHSDDAETRAKLNWFNAWRVGGCDGAGSSTLACLKHEGPGIEVGVHLFSMFDELASPPRTNFPAMHTTLRAYHVHRATPKYLVPICNSAELLNTIERACTADAAHAYIRDVATQKSHLWSGPRGGPRVLCIVSPVLSDRRSAVL